LVNVALALEESGANNGKFRFSDSRQIGWFQGHGTATPTQSMTFLDPDHIIVQDLWIGAYAVDTNDSSTERTSVELNYHIVIQTIDSSMNEAVMQLIKERSQDTD